MGARTESALYRAGELTFEELGLIATNEELDEAQREARPAAAACLRFNGVIKGQLRVILCGDVLPELAANMLGEAAHPPVEVQRDALGELVNVICGNFLPLITNPREVFRLSLPCLAGVLEVCGNCDYVPAGKVSIGLEGGRADVLLFLQGVPGQENLE
jgi:chemotaxis protein CheX